MSTYTQICYHVVFSTKGREPVLKAEGREELFRYTWGILKNRSCHLYRIGGVDDHLHILTSLHPTVCLADLVKDVKTGKTRVGSTLRINARRRESGPVWQPRFFDRALRTVNEYHEKIDYIHLKPVKAGLASRPEDWPWSSVHDYTGSVQCPVATPSGLRIDRVLLPADERTRI